MPLTRDFESEVLVVGAGASGIPATIGAARAGATVLLIDEDPVVGGAPVDAFVAAFCGTPRTGIVKEVEEELQSSHSIGQGRRFFLPASWQRVFGKLLSRESNLTVLLGARAIDVIRTERGGRRAVGGVLVEIDGAPVPDTFLDATVSVASVSGTVSPGTISVSRVPAVAIRSKVTIDATGTGLLAIKAGCAAMYGRDAKDDFAEPHAQPQRDSVVQDCTWMYFSQQFGDGPPLDMMKLDNIRPGVLVDGLGWYHSDPDRAMAMKPRLYLHWGCAVKCRDTRDHIEIARTQQEALRAMERDHALLREHGYAVYLSPRLGIRETSRVVGEHVITENDLMSGRLPDDYVAIGMYGLDIWGGADKGHALIARTPAYGIPYRALVPKGVDGLLLAGKAISGTHVAMSAYRVMPIVGAAGQAAGVAAALCVQQNQQPRQIDPAEVRKALSSAAQQLQLEFQ